MIGSQYLRPSDMEEEDPRASIMQDKLGYEKIIEQRSRSVSPRVIEHAERATLIAPKAKEDLIYDEIQKPRYTLVQL